MKFIFWSAGCSLLRAEGFFCGLDVLYGAQRISKFQFWSKQEKKNSAVLFINFGPSKPWIHLKCWIRIQVQWIRIHNTAFSSEEVFLPPPPPPSSTTNIGRKLPVHLPIALPTSSLDTVLEKLCSFNGDAVPLNPGALSPRIRFLLCSRYSFPFLFWFYSSCIPFLWASKVRCARMTAVGSLLPPPPPGHCFHPLPCPPPPSKYTWSGIDRLGFHRAGHCLFIIYLFMLFNTALMYIWITNKLWGTVYPTLLRSNPKTRTSKKDKFVAYITEIGKTSIESFLNF
jgi:hypothetical protein